MLKKTVTVLFFALLVFVGALAVLKLINSNFPGGYSGNEFIDPTYIVSPSPVITGGTEIISPEITIPEDDQVFCTMDAKLCPDGSSVGRGGPNCEFAPCPGE